MCLCVCVARGVVSYTSVTSFGPKQRRRLALWFDLRSLACADTSAATGAMPIALPPARAANYVAVWSLPYDKEDPERWNFVFVEGTFDNSEIIDFLDRFQSQREPWLPLGGIFCTPREHRNHTCLAYKGRAQYDGLLRRIL